MRTALVAAAILWLLPVPACAGDPDVLWKIVHGHCVAGQREIKQPTPCISVDLGRGEAFGTAVLKDSRGVTQYLLIPTARITGIEAPAILTPGAPNYFAAAWAATALVDERLHRVLSRRDFALAINSEDGRSQDQLHIHVDCIRPDTRAALDRVSDEIGGHWHDLPMRLLAHRYRALWLPGDLLDSNPFRILAASLADPAREMGRHTLVLVGATRHGHPGFILLDGMSAPHSISLTPRLKVGFGSGEELEDHSCRIATQSG